MFVLFILLSGLFFYFPPSVVATLVYSDSLDGTMAGWDSVENGTGGRTSAVVYNGTYSFKSSTDAGNTNSFLEKAISNQSITRVNFRFYLPDALTDQSQYYRFGSWYYSGNGTYLVIWRLHPSGSFGQNIYTLDAYDAVDAEYISSYNLIIEPDSWVSFDLVADCAGGSISMYMNNELVGKKDGLTLLQSYRANQLFIGQFYTNTYISFYVDDIQIHNDLPDTSTNSPNNILPFPQAWDNYSSTNINLDPAVTYLGTSSICASHNTGTNYAQESNAGVIPITAGQHILFSAWIKTNSSTFTEFNNNPASGTGGRIGIDFYDSSTIVAGASVLTLGFSNGTGIDGAPDIVAAGSCVPFNTPDWTLQFISVTVPDYSLNIKSFIPWFQTLTNTYDYGASWLANATLYIDSYKIEPFTDSGVSVTFTNTTYNLVTPVGGIANVSCAVVKAGHDQVVNYAAVSGSSLYSLTVDGFATSLATYPSSYTFSTVTDDHTLVLVSTVYPTPTPTPYIPSTAPQTEIDLYFHGTTTTVNTIAGYVASTSPPRVSAVTNETNAGSCNVSFGVRIYIVSASGVTSELTSGVQTIGILLVGETATNTLIQTDIDIATTTISFRQTSLAFYYYIKFNAGSWVPKAVFTTESLDYKRILAATWTVNLYVSRSESGGVTVGGFSWGSSSSLSGVEGLLFKDATPTDWQQYYLNQHNFAMFLLIPYTLVAGNVFYGIILVAIGGTLFIRYRTLGMAALFLIIILGCIGGGAANIIFGEILTGVLWIILAFGLAVLYWRAFR